MTPTGGLGVRLQYESQDLDGQWWRSYGNEKLDFDEQGLMRRAKQASTTSQLTNLIVESLALAAKGKALEFRGNEPTCHE